MAAEPVSEHRRLRKGPQGGGQGLFRDGHADPVMVVFEAKIARDTAASGRLMHGGDTDGVQRTALRAGTETAYS